MKKIDKKAESGLKCLKVKEKKIKKIDKNKQRHQRKPKVFFVLYKYRHFRPLLTAFGVGSLTLWIAFGVGLVTPPTPY